MPGSRVRLSAMPSKPLRLTRKGLLDKVQAKSNDIVLVRRNVPRLAYVLGRAANLTENDVATPAWVVPQNTVSAILATSRRQERVVEFPVEGAPRVIEYPKNLAAIVRAGEITAGTPIQALCVKRESGLITVIHTERQELPLPEMLHALRDLLDKVGPNDRGRIFGSVPRDVGDAYAQRFADAAVAGAYEGTAAYPGILVAPRGDVFVAETTTPADVAAMQDAWAILTGGGQLSHAALLAASEGIPCVVGLSAKAIKAIQKWKGEVSVDAHRGCVYLGKLEIVDADPQVALDIVAICTHARHHVEVDVYANADSAAAISAALSAGATGVGLLRTEHMWQEHTGTVSEYLSAALGGDLAGRRRTLSALLPIARKLHAEAFEAASGRYVAVRLLDAPLAEFGARYEETNPMMGLRGCRFGILFSDFYAMQVQAIAEAHKRAKGGGEVGIMVPLVSEVGELVVLRDLVRRVWAACRAPEDALKFGVMVETPRACVVSAEIAPWCDFIAYGTNDLTQFTFGLSRDDVVYLPNYVQLGVLEKNPFVTIDERGVGRLMFMSSAMARTANPEIRLGACGGHAGDPESIRFMREYMHLDYVSCTRAAIPGAYLALAQ